MNSNWQEIKSGSSNGFPIEVDKPIPVPMLTKF